jgi:hypothetical protein
MGGGISRGQSWLADKVNCCDFSEEILAKAKETTINGRWGIVISVNFEADIATTLGVG